MLWRRQQPLSSSRLPQPFGQQLHGGVALRVGGVGCLVVVVVPLLQRWPGLLLLLAMRD